jgi:CBS domain-containing protein
MNVRDLMSPPDVTVTPDTPVAEAARLLLDSSLPGIPVVENGRLVGVVTRRDVVTKHAHVHLPVFIGLLGYVAPFELPGTREEMQRVLAVTVRDLMGTDVKTIEAAASVDDAATLMVEHAVDPIPVLDNGALVGVISMGDIIRLVLVEEGDGAGSQ